MKRIIVTGTGGSAGTNFIRSLRISPEKFYIVGVDIDKYHIKLSQSDKNYLVPKCTEVGYIEKLNEIIDKEKIEFLHCQPDTEVKVLSENVNLLHANTFLPSLKTINLAQDKYEFNKMLAFNNIPTPNAQIVNSPQDLRTFISSPSKFWLRAIRGAGSLAALPITNPEQGEMWVNYWATRGIGWGEFMISEYLPGKEYAFQSIWKDGELITSAARERIEYLFQNRMPSGQSSTPTIAKSVHNNLVNIVASEAIKVLDNNANGVFCVDLKEDTKGFPCVTEINVGRFFTTSLFFSVAGSNMPYLYVKLGYGEKIPSQSQYNAVPKDLLWLRQIDMGEVMIKENEL